MTIYIVCFAFLVGLGICLTRQEDKKNNELYLAIVFLVFFGIAVFRSDDIGADTEVYIDGFNYFAAMPKTSVLFTSSYPRADFEIGYEWINKLVAFFCPNSRIFLAIVAFIIYFSLVEFIYKYSNVYWLSIAVYMGLGIYVYSLGLFRQMLAASIVLYAFKYIVKQKPIHFLLIVLLAMFIHKTALCVLPLYFANKIKINRNFVFYGILLELILIVFADFLIAFLLQVFPVYARYLGTEYADADGSYFFLIMLNIIFIFVCLTRRGSKLQQDDMCDNVCCLALLLAICLQSLGYSFGLLGRAVTYYTIYLVILLPDFINRTFETRSKKFIELAILILMFIYFIRRVYGNQFICPYHLFISI